MEYISAMLVAFLSICGIDMYMYMFQAKIKTCNIFLKYRDIHPYNSDKATKNKQKKMIDFTPVHGRYSYLLVLQDFYSKKIFPSQMCT